MINPGDIVDLPQPEPPPQDVVFPLHQNLTTVSLIATLSDSVQKALDLATNALLNNRDCAGLFGPHERITRRLVDAAV